MRVASLTPSLLMVGASSSDRFLLFRRLMRKFLSVVGGFGVVNCLLNKLVMTLWSVIVSFLCEKRNLMGSLRFVFVALSRFFMVLRSLAESVLWSNVSMNSRHFDSLHFLMDLWILLFRISVSLSWGLLACSWSLSVINFCALSGSCGITDLRLSESTWCLDADIIAFLKVASPW